MFVDFRAGGRAVCKENYGFPLAAELTSLAVGFASFVTPASWSACCSQLPLHCFFAFQQLFMSANSSPSPSSRPSPADRSAEQSLLEKAGLAGSDVEPVEESSKDCVVCQNGGVNWVLLPCRHACLCDSCVCYFRQCPMCRQFVQESFALCSQKEPDKDMLEAS